MSKENKERKERILFYDIETSPNIGYFWKPGRKVSISHDNIIQEKKIICICYKFSGEKKTHHLTWDTKTQDDKAMLAKFSEVVKTADLLVGHNGDRFDLATIKGRLLANNLPPLATVQTADTLKLCRANFALNSNRLDYLGELLEGHGKISVGFGLWKAVMDGDRKALKEMVTYCIRDVELLENVFNKIAPYCTNLTYSKSVMKKAHRHDCPCCGSSNVQARGYVMLKSGRYQRFQCQDCGKWSRALGKSSKTRKL